MSIVISAVNARRGEMLIAIDGAPVRLRLTLGALAELEGAMGVDDLAALAARLSRGALSARDLLAILTVAMRGGGHDDGAVQAAGVAVAGALPQLAAVIARLLTLTFGAAGEGGADELPFANAPATQPPQEREPLSQRLFRGLRSWGLVLAGWALRQTPSGR